MEQLKRIVTILMAAMVLVGSTGFAIEKFYCGSHLRSIHVFTSPTPCCSQTNEPGGSCRTEKVYLNADFNSHLPNAEMNVELEQVLIGTLSAPLHFIFFEHSERPIAYLHYKPPLLYKDIPVFVQSFLI